MAPNERLAALSAAGVSIWLDDLSRERLHQRQPAGADHRQERRRGHHQPDDLRRGAGERRRPTTQQVRELAARGASIDDAVREITVADVRRPATCSRGTWEHTGGVDGRVSLEVDPRLAHDTEATLAEALDLWKAVDRPNLLVKIPATEAGLPAITQALAEGVSVNVTLIFSVERYRDVMERLPGRAWSRPRRTGTTWPASPRWPASSSPASTPRSTSGWRRSAPTRRWRCAARPASRTPGWPTPRSRRSSQGERWDALAAQGAKPQRPLWASTGVKNPDYSDTMYVTELVVADTVNTMPEKTLQAFADHGEVDGDTGHRHRRAGAGGLRRPRARRDRPHRRVPRAGERGRRQVREVVDGAARHRQGPARRGQVSRS